jgi:hypothetical protein
LIQRPASAWKLCGRWRNGWQGTMPEPVTISETVVWGDLPGTRRQRLAVLVGQLAWRMAQGHDVAEAGHEPLEADQRDTAEQDRRPPS